MLPEILLCQRTIDNQVKTCGWFRSRKVRVWPLTKTYVKITYSIVTKHWYETFFLFEINNMGTKQCLPWICTYYKQHGYETLCKIQCLLWLFCTYNKQHRYEIPTVQAVHLSLCLKKSRLTKTRLKNTWSRIIHGRSIQCVYWIFK